MEKLKKIVLAVFLIGSIVYSQWSIVYAAVPHLINYQGRLTDSGGVPLNGTYSLTFRIYDAETAGSLLWEEIQSGAVIQKGIFNILLGSVTNLNLAFDKQYYLEIKVGSEVMSPRQRITSAGYAIRAEEAEKLGGKQSSDYVLATDITSAPTANKAVKLDSNAKLPVAALKVYDSGWFAIANNTAYSKTHNLGTTKVLPIIYVSENSDGSGKCVSAFLSDSYSAAYGVFMTSLSTTAIALRIGAQHIYYGIDATGAAWAPDSGYCRVIMLALE